MIVWFRAPGVHSESGFYSYAHAHNNLYAIGGRIKSEFSLYPPDSSSDEQNPIFKSNFLPFCIELYYPRARYCRTDVKVSIRRARGVEVALPKNVSKLKLVVNTIYQKQGYELHHTTTKQYRV